MSQADDCKLFGYTWVIEPDETVKVIEFFVPKAYGYNYPTFFKVVPKVRQ